MPNFHFYNQFFRSRLIIFYGLFLYVNVLHAQTCTTADAIRPADGFVGTMYPSYTFFHKDGTQSTTFYKDETIYSMAPTTTGTCLSPNTAIFRTPNFPADFTSLCTGFKNYTYYKGTSNDCGTTGVINQSCPKVGPLQYVGNFVQKFQPTKSGEYTITFNNGNGTTVALKILERFCVQTDHLNFKGVYIESGTKNGKKLYIDADNNELFYDNITEKWIIANTSETAYSVASTADTPPITGWQIAGSETVGKTVTVSVGDCSIDPLTNPITYSYSAVVTGNCFTRYNGEYTQTGIVNNRPVLTGPNNYQIVFNGNNWQLGTDFSVGYLANLSNSLIPPSTCWGIVHSSGAGCSQFDVNVTVTPSLTLATPKVMCVRSACTNLDGVYTQTTYINQRPSLLDSDQNKIFYWGAGDPNRPEGWYISDINGKFIYYNNSTATSPPTTGWQAFTVDGINCSSNIGVFDTECTPCPSISASISYGSTLCKSLTESTVTLTGTTGGTFSSTQGLSIDANSGTINPSTSTAGTYTVTYTIVGTNGCANTTTTTSVTIEDSKTPSVVLAANPSGSITTGTSVTFTATPTNGGTVPTYVWKKNNVVIPNETGVIYTTNTLANGDKIKVEISSNDACASPTTATSNEITTTVNTCTFTPSNITITYIGGGFLGFSGPPQAPAIYTPNGTLNNAPRWSNQFGYIIRWSGSPSNRWEIVHQSDLNFIIASNASGSISNIPCASTNWVVNEEYAGGIILGGGCGSLTPQMVAPSVVLAANPSGSITTGTNVTFTATPTNGGTAPTYIWKKNDVVVSGETGATYTTNTLANGDKIKVEMSSSNACASPTTATSNELTMAVNSCTNPPSATISYTGSPFCVSMTNALPTLTGTTGGFYQYTDETDDISINGATGAISSSVPATYHIEYIIEAANGCPAVTASTEVIVVAKPNVPTINIATKVVCFPNNLTLTASGCAGTITWSDNSTGTSLTLSSVGTYSISATCTVNSCTSEVSPSVTGLEIKAKPTPPTITPPTEKVVCSPNTITLTANCALGTVVWSTGATGTSLTLSTVGTYSISATCTTIPANTPTSPNAVSPTITGCNSEVSPVVNGLEIKAKPTPPTITPPTEKVVCSPNTITLTANCALGTVVWSTGATGSSLTLSSVGTYSISATCTTIPANTPTSTNAVSPPITGCTSNLSTSITGLEIKAKPSPPTINPPTEKVVCSPNNLILTANCTLGTVVWSTGATGTSLTLTNTKTYAISATCSTIPANTTNAISPSITGCASDPSTSITGLEIKAKPSPPTINPPTEKVVCSPNNLILTANCTLGTVVWSTGATGTSLTLTNTGTYAISATCTTIPANTTNAVSPPITGCNSEASPVVNGLEIKAKPTPPTINLPTEKVICSPNTITLTANCALGTVIWSTGATGTSLTLSTVGTYSISATCTTIPASTPTAPNAVSPTITGCNSEASSIVNGLEIKAKPTPPTINLLTEKIVCSPNTITLTANCALGTVVWSTGATGTSLTLSSVGTYSVSATCTVNGCTSDVSSVVNGLEIKAKPTPPTITPPTEKVVCSPNNLTLTANCTLGTVVWSTGATGTSLTLSTVGTYSISATCTTIPANTPTSSNAVSPPITGCTSDPSTSITGLEIKAKPAPPTINAPVEKVVCSPNNLTLTANCTLGTVVWSTGATGTSLTLTSTGTYAISATCTTIPANTTNVVSSPITGCTSDPSTSITGLEIKAKPAPPTINAPVEKVVCFPSTLILNAADCAGIVIWSNGSSGASLTLSNVGTYAISATCNVNGCISEAAQNITGLEIKALPNAQAVNTGPYIVGQVINLIGSGGTTYNWSGPNSFSSTQNAPSINNAMLANAGIYTLTVTAHNNCKATATTNIIITGVDLCDPARIVDYVYVKAGNPYQALFPLTDGLVINQRNEQVSILVNNVCPSVTINSFEMNIQGPELNWNIIQNVAPYTLFDNFKLDVFGRNFVPGNYTLTVTGYAGVNKSGAMTYGSKIIKFTVVGDLATINAPILSKSAICAGSNVDVTINTSGVFSGNNQFQVQLSDSSGSFASPIIIGNANSTGTITCMIPLNTIEGSKYLIRVASSNQVVASNPAMSFVKVHPFNFVLNNLINNISGNETIKAVSTINANNKVSSPANISYQAGNSILLSPGFESSAVFKAEIKGCN